MLPNGSARDSGDASRSVPLCGPGLARGCVCPGAGGRLLHASVRVRASTWLRVLCLVCVRAPCGLGRRMCLGRLCRASPCGGAACPREP